MVVDGSSRGGSTFCACLRLVSFSSSRSRWSSVVGWRMLCRCAALADALPPCRWLEFSPDGCIVVVVGQLGGCFATLFVADLRTFGDVVPFSRSSCW